MLRACLRGANATARVSLLSAPQPPANVSVLSFSDPEPASRCHSEFCRRLIRAVNSSVLSSAVFEAMQLVVEAVKENSAAC